MSEYGVRRQASWRFAEGGDIRIGRMFVDTGFHWEETLRFCKEHRSGGRMLPCRRLGADKRKTVGCGPIIHSEMSAANARRLRLLVSWVFLAEFMMNPRTSDVITTKRLATSLICSKRRQLFFSTKTEATAECERLKARKDNFGVSLTAMTPARIAEAAEAHKLLDPIGVSLLDAVRDYVAGHKRRNESISFEALFNLFLEAKADRNPAYLNELRVTRDRDEMRNLGNRLACDIGVRDLEPILNTMTSGARNPVMRYLRAVFNYGIKRGYLTENPIARLDFAVRPRQEVETIPVEQVGGMLNHTLENDLELLAFLVFGFFTGIRPEGELSELEWSDVRPDEIVIRPEVSKTNRRRFIDLSENAKAWLQAYSDRGGFMEGKVVRYNASELRTHRRANWQASGITDWPQQGMRHTFCSCWLAANHDINRLVLMSGHDSVDTMWRAYHAGIPESEAEKFWNIRPPQPVANVVPMTKAS